MEFRHADEIWRDFPDLVPGVVFTDGITADVSVTDSVARYCDIARDRLAGGGESEFPEIQAWRRAFARMGLKPTQYRCASESLLRRFRKEGSLPSLHPLVDLCNAISLAFAIPVAALDVAQVAGDLEVRYATGAEEYLTFAGDVEHPSPGEVIFADQAGQAHARRWTNRQSGRSAVRDSTTKVLIVAEALHAAAPADVPRLLTALTADLTAHWPASPTTPPAPAILTPRYPTFNSPVAAPVKLGLHSFAYTCLCTLAISGRSVCPSLRTAMILVTYSPAPRKRWGDRSAYPLPHMPRTPQETRTGGARPQLRRKPGAKRNSSVKNRRKSFRLAPDFRAIHGHDPPWH
jgi:DNA/RNA-binding domain of Phe-tRNA-synthetase-like protein